VIGALTAASGRASWEGLCLVWVVWWDVEGVWWSQEPELVAVETADVSAAQARDQHAVDYLAADDAGEFGWEGLSGFAVGAAPAGRLAPMSLGGGVWCHGVFVEDG
jgi:hypothetical protein